MSQFNQPQQQTQTSPTTAVPNIYAQNPTGQDPASRLAKSGMGGQDIFNLLSQYGTSPQGATQQVPYAPPNPYSGNPINPAYQTPIGPVENAFAGLTPMAPGQNPYMISTALGQVPSSVAGQPGFNLTPQFNPFYQQLAAGQVPGAVSGQPGFGLTPQYNPLFQQLASGQVPTAISSQPGFNLTPQYNPFTQSVAQGQIPAALMQQYQQQQALNNAQALEKLGGARFGSGAATVLGRENAMGLTNLMANMANMQAGAAGQIYGQTAAQQAAAQQAARDIYGQSAAQQQAAMNAAQGIYGQTADQQARALQANQQLLSQFGMTAPALLKAEQDRQRQAQQLQYQDYLRQQGVPPAIQLLLSLAGLGGGTSAGTQTSSPGLMGLLSSLIGASGTATGGYLGGSALAGAGGAGLASEVAPAMAALGVVGL